MKQILFFFLMLFSFASFGQSRATLMDMSGDTVANSGTAYVQINVKAAATTATFQVVNNKISGAVAGKSYFMASNDGVNFVKLDSLTNLDISTNTKIFSDNPARYQYYRLSSTGSGTMAYRTYGYAVFRR